MWLALCANTHISHLYRNINTTPDVQKKPPRVHGQPMAIVRIQAHIYSTPYHGHHSAFQWRLTKQNSKLKKYWLTGPSTHPQLLPDRSTSDVKTWPVCVPECFINNPVWSHCSMPPLRRRLSFSASPWDGTCLHQIPWGSQDVLYRKPMWSFLLVVEAGGTQQTQLVLLISTLKNTMHLLLRLHYPNGYKVLQFDKIMTITWNKGQWNPHGWFRGDN